MSQLHQFGASPRRVGFPSLRSSTSSPCKIASGFARHNTKQKLTARANVTPFSSSCSTMTVSLRARNHQRRPTGKKEEETHCIVTRIGTTLD